MSPTGEQHDVACAPTRAYAHVHQRVTQPREGAGLARATTQTDLSARRSGDAGRARPRGQRFRRCGTCRTGASRRPGDPVHPDRGGLWGRGRGRGWGRRGRLFSPGWRQTHPLFQEVAAAGGAKPGARAQRRVLPATRCPAQWPLVPGVQPLRARWKESTAGPRRVTALSPAGPSPPPEAASAPQHLLRSTQHPGIPTTVTRFPVISAAGAAKQHRSHQSPGRPFPLGQRSPRSLQHALSASAGQWSTMQP